MSRHAGGEQTALRCAGIQRFVDTYLDGEFAETDRAEFESHLSSCNSCRNKVRLQAEWKLAIKAANPKEAAPEELRQRIQRSVISIGSPVKKAPVGEFASWRRWAYRALPLGAAAGLLTSFLFSKVAWSPVAEDVIAKHRRNLPIEVSGGFDQVKKWYADKVDFPVRPPSFGKAGAALRGGRLANIGDRQAAYLVYDVDGNKVSVFIFDPGEVPLEFKKKRVIGNRDVYFDEERGYNIAMYRDRGVGFAIASDLDQAQMVKLVSSAVSP